MLLADISVKDMQSTPQPLVAMDRRLPTSMSLMDMMLFVSLHRNFMSQSILVVCLASRLLLGRFLTAKRLCRMTTDEMVSSGMRNLRKSPVTGTISSLPMEDGKIGSLVVGKQPFRQ